MARYALHDENDEVVNICEWDGVTPFDPAPLVARPATQEEIDAFELRVLTANGDPPDSNENEGEAHA